MAEWRFLNTGTSHGLFNMAVDAAILAGIEDGTSPPTVRVYAWAPPTVSIGYAQKPDEELDLERCREAGVGVVRRPTGGRAVLHAGELTYSVVGRSGEPPLGGSIAEAYRAIAEALVRGLAGLGVKALLAPAPSAGPGRSGAASPPCFVSTGRFEIVAGGRKLVGSAQRRTDRAVLQHGSLLLDASHSGLADLLRVRSDGEREVLRRMLTEKTADLKTLLEAAPGFRRTATAVRAGFEERWGERLADGALSECEKRVAKELATEYAV